MLGFGAKKKRSVESWRRRARWIDLEKTRVIIISPETQIAVDNSKDNTSISYSPNVPCAIDSSDKGPTLHQMETCDDFLGTQVSYEDIYSVSLGMKGQSFEKEIDVRNLGKNKWIVRTLKNFPSKTK